MLQFKSFSLESQLVLNEICLDVSATYEEHFQLVSSFIVKTGN